MVLCSRQQPFTGRDWKRCRLFALDKTGTITEWRTESDRYHSGSGVTEDTLLKYAYALENKSEHPLAKQSLKRQRRKIVEHRRSYRIPGPSG